MQIIPAIDIRAGRCVRLEQGDYARETVYSDGPAAVARRWQDAGAQRLHVVDLDGARDGRPGNQDAVRAILAVVTIPVQLGGGIRDIAGIEQWLATGVDRVFLGTAAVADQTTLLNAVTLFRQRVAVAVDARDGIVRTAGWTESSGVLVGDLIPQLSEIGVSRILYTDISRDGTLSGPNFAALAQLLDQVAGLPASLAVIASGGVSTLEHLRALSDTGVEGAIVGKALYTGAIDLAEALADAASP